MNKNLIYLLLVLVLGALTYYYVYREPGQDFSKNEANFTVKNIDAIKTIFLTDPNGNKIKLTKPKDEWIANDSIEIVQSAAKDLLEALRDQRPVQPVRLGSHDEVITEMSSDNTKVEIYTDEGKTNTFYVSRKQSPNNLTYMLTEGAKRPYVVRLPIQNTFLGIRYSTDMNNWRSRKILHAKADEIEMIDVTYKDSTQYSFHLINKKGSTPVLTGNQTIAKPLNIKRVNTYLGLWDSIYCLGFEIRNRIKDTIITNGHVLATVSIKKINAPLQTLVIYFKPLSKGTKGILNVGKEQYDFDAFMGFLNNRDLIVMTRKYTQIMLRSFPEFFEEEKK